MTTAGIKKILPLVIFFVAATFFSGLAMGQYVPPVGVAACPGGDLSGTPPNCVVATVGSSTAANVHAAELLANAATSANTASAIVRRDGSGNFVAGSPTFTGLTTTGNSYLAVSGGNVGIGTSTPGDKLTVQDGSLTSARTDSTTTQGVFFTTAGTYDWGIRPLAGSRDLTFMAEGATGAIMTLSRSGGNVGIGVTGPAYLALGTGGAAGSSTTPLNAKINFLGYSGVAKGSIFVQDQQSTLAGGWMKFQTSDSSNTLQDRVMIDRGGNVGIGTSSPAYTLDVAGPTRLTGIIGGGSSPTISGCTTSGQAGGNTIGQFTSGTTGACTATLTFSMTAPNAWTCRAEDQTTFTSFASIFHQTGGTPTTATIAATTVTGDVVKFVCLSY